MRLGLLFPDVESFRPGMAVETYEHYAVVRHGYEELDSVVSRGLTRRVLYPTRRDRGLAAHERRAAVLTASVGLYCLYRQTCSWARASASSLPSWRRVLSPSGRP